MALSRRKALIGIGGLVAGGGALVGTGAFTTVEAERTVNVETSGDASAFLALEPSGEPNGDYADAGGNTGTIEITLDSSAGENAAQGLNQDAITTIRRIVTVTNNGTQAVESLTLEMSDPNNNINPDDTFSFTVTKSQGQGQGQGNLNQAEVNNGEDLLGSNGLDDSLTTGDSLDFGMVVDLLAGGNQGDLPDGNYNLTITAETANS